jgi:hypothetical protein
MTLGGRELAARAAGAIFRAPKEFEWDAALAYRLARVEMSLDAADMSVGAT